MANEAGVALGMVVALPAAGLGVWGLAAGRTGYGVVWLLVAAATAVGVVLNLRHLRSR